jgi:hypothetical protein
MSAEKEVSKEEFKKLYFQYAQPHSGWTADYWDKFFEPQTGKKYYFTTPTSPAENRMFIDEGKESTRLYFLTEEAEESFFDPHDHSEPD